MADRVLDGTPCGPYETDLCVHGKCQVICFPCVFGGTFFGGEAPSPPEVFGVVGGGRAETLGGLGGMDLLKKALRVLSPANWHPSSLSSN